jgi:hypothetical protein
MAFHQAVEHVHVAEHQAGLLRRHHDVFAAQLLAGAGGHEQRDDLVEILGGALAEIAGAPVGVGQAEFGLLAFRPMPGSTRPSATTTPSSPSTGSRRSPLVGSALPRGALGFFFGRPNRKIAAINSRPAARMPMRNSAVSDIR